MSKTERDLAGDEVADALDQLFDDQEFDEALDAALDAADDEVPGDRVDDDSVDDDTAELSTDVDDPAVDDAAVDDDETAADADTADDTAADDVGEEHGEGTEHDDEPEATEAELADADDEPTAADETDADGGEIAVDPAGEYEFPEIVPATPDQAEETDDAEAFVEEEVEEELDADEVAEEILEELRRADIDGPQVEMAPQDETTAARRRPRRAVDYDPAPMPIPAQVPRVLGRKPRVRKVTRVVRHVDPWSVFKIAIVANLVLYITVLTAGVLLWNVAHATGTVDNVERFFESFGWESFEFKGGEIYHAAWIAGLFAAIGLTGLAVLLATLFNLITDLVGGVRFTVLEEEVVETRTSPLRRFVVRRPEPEVPAKISDASGAMYREAVVDDTGANQRPSR